MKIYEFIYTDCVFESAMATMSINRTKKGAYKAMRKFLMSDFMEWYNDRIRYGKNHRGGKHAIHCDWAIRTRILND